MATEEDNFDIDIYGDGGGEEYQQEAAESTGAEKHSESGTNPQHATANHPPEPYPNTNGYDGQHDHRLGDNHMQQENVAQKIASTDDSSHDLLQLPKQAPQTQGLKRKEGSDNRFADPAATSALYISELHWWVTDDDIRGWANQSQCEDELEDVTFNEHKVNGKSKGQAYVLFKSPQAATATKQKIESFGDGQQYTKKFTVTYTNPFTNPFRTLPKDGPTRNSNSMNRPGQGYGGSGSTGVQQTGYNSYRSGRGGGYNSRGSMNGMSNYNRGGFQQPMTGMFQGSPVGGFQGIGSMPSYGGFHNRGGMMGNMRGSPMGMRGGRVGMGPTGAMGMPNMGGMMGGMAGMSMGMPQMSAGMAMQEYLAEKHRTGQGGFQPNQAHYNPAFFNQQASGSPEATWNPHGAKRTRQE
ncbi:MAG: hypothetical protein Q9177_000102 [Variospora cf. flavescens]